MWWLLLASAVALIILWLMFWPNEPEDPL